MRRLTYYIIITNVAVPITAPYPKKLRVLINVYCCHHYYGVFVIATCITIILDIFLLYQVVIYWLLFSFLSTRARASLRRFMSYSIIMILYCNIILFRGTHEINLTHNNNDNTYYYTVNSSRQADSRYKTRCMAMYEWYSVSRTTAGCIHYWCCESGRLLSEPPYCHIVC